LFYQAFVSGDSGKLTTPLPLLTVVVPGQGLGEPPEPRSRDRFRIDPTKATRL
jgi:hypothetical protein